MGFWSGRWIVIAGSWMVNMRAILRGEKRSEKIRVERPDSLLNFDMAIYSGDHNRERRGKMYWRQKTPLSFFFFSKPLPKSSISPGAGGKRARECPTADKDNKMGIP